LAADRNADGDFWGLLRGKSGLSRPSGVEGLILGGLFPLRLVDPVMAQDLMGSVASLGAACGVTRFLIYRNFAFSPVQIVEDQPG
jgi:hypothetical protein